MYRFFFPYKIYNTSCYNNSLNHITYLTYFHPLNNKNNKIDNYEFATLNNGITIIAKNNKKFLFPDYLEDISPTVKEEVYNKKNKKVYLEDFEPQIVSLLLECVEKVKLALYSQGYRVPNMKTSDTVIVHYILYNNIFPLLEKEKKSKIKSLLEIINYLAIFELEDVILDVIAFRILPSVKRRFESKFSLELNLEKMTRENIGSLPRKLKNILQEIAIEEELEQYGSKDLFQTNSFLGRLYLQLLQKQRLSIKEYIAINGLLENILEKNTLSLTKKI